MIPKIICDECGAEVEAGSDNPETEFVTVTVPVEGTASVTVLHFCSAECAGKNLTAFAEAEADGQ